MSVTSATEPTIKYVTEISSDDLALIRECLEINRRIQNQMTGEKWLNSKEAAKYIKKSVSHLNNRLAERIGYSQCGREFLFKREDLDRYLMRDYKPAKD